MAEMAGVPMYIVHLSSEDALNQVREARDRGLPAFAETCPQYLLLSLEDNMVDKGWEGAKYVFTPPLRERSNQPKLWEGLRNDNLQVVSTDHCPFCFEDQKALGKDDFTKIPNGGPGIENRLQLLHHHGVGMGNCRLNRFVEIVSTAPARIFGMYPKKGVLAAGQRCGPRAVGSGGGAHDFSAATHHMRVDYSMFEGFKVKGNARDVYSRGELIVSKGEFIGKAGRGNYLRQGGARGGVEVKRRVVRFQLSDHELCGVANCRWSQQRENSRRSFRLHCHSAQCQSQDDNGWTMRARTEENRIERC